MADNNNIGGDAHGFDNIDSSDSASDGDDSDFGGDGVSKKYNGGGYEFNGGRGGGGDNIEAFDFCEGDNQPHATMPIPPIDNEPWDAHQLKCLYIYYIGKTHAMLYFYYVGDIFLKAIHSLLHI